MVFKTTAIDHSAIPPLDHFIREIRSPERPLDDHVLGKASGRYLEAELPTLPVADAAFDLALCYSERSAATGSTLVARRPGPWDATSATASIAITATTIGTVVSTGSVTGASA